MNLSDLYSCKKRKIFLVLKNTVVRDPSISTGFATLRANVGYLCPQCTKTEKCTLIIYFLTNIKYGKITLQEVGKKSNAYLSCFEIGEIKSRIYSINGLQYLLNVSAAEAKVEYNAFAEVKATLAACEFLQMHLSKKLIVSSLKIPRSFKNLHRTNL